MLSAIEPPHWMATRASYLRQRGHKVTVFDMAVEKKNELRKLMGCDKIEIWPTGVHPSAFIQEQEGINKIFTKTSSALYGDITVHNKLNFSPLNITPAWDLFDLSKYQCHNWQAWGLERRSPYGTLHTSISCPYSCKFCAIKGYYGEKYKRRGVNEVISDLKVLYDNGVRHIKIMDELFIINQNWLQKFCEEIISNGMTGLNIWGYGRIDTMWKLDIYPLMRKAGINWICLGIESGNQGIRESMSKGTFTNNDIENVVKMLKDSGINVLGNYMLGFPEDNMKTMHETLDFAIALNCEYSNFYCVVAYPKTEVEKYAIWKRWKLPRTYSGYSQYSYEFQPLPTNHVSAREVLAFRDKAWIDYHSTMRFTHMLEDKFGENVSGEMVNIIETKLKRKILEGTYEDFYRRKNGKIKGAHKQ